MAGCAGMAPTPSRHPELRSLIQPVELVLYIPQKDLIVLPENAWMTSPAVTTGLCLVSFPTCAVVGLVGPQLEEAIILRPDKRSAPLRDAIASVDFDRRFATALAASLGAEDMPVQKWTVFKESTSSREDNEAFLASTAGSVLHTMVAYYVPPDFSSLRVSVQVEVFARAKAARSILQDENGFGDDRGKWLSSVNAFYWTAFHYELPLASSGKDADGNIAVWKQDDARLFREGLLDAIEQATGAVAHDFGSRVWADAPKGPKVEKRGGGSARLIEEVPGKGRLLRLNGGAVLFEATSGSASGNADADTAADAQPAPVPAAEVH